MYRAKINSFNLKGETNKIIKTHYMQSEIFQAIILMFNFDDYGLQDMNTPTSKSQKI